MTNVLIVEDDLAAASMLGLALQRAGMHITIVGTGAEALLAADDGFHAVLLDLGLPDMDGLEVCRMMHSRHPTLPIIVVSGRWSEPDVVMALDAGADDYVQKPFRTQELLARLRSVQRRVGRSAMAGVGDIVLDAERSHVSVRGKRVPLTPKEFEVLIALMHNAGRIVTRERLLETLWGSGMTRESKSLDMHVSALRRKLRDAGSAESIRTVRGVGFGLGA